MNRAFLLILAVMAVSSGPARAEVTEVLPELHEGIGPGERQARDAPLGFTRRADVPERAGGDVSLGVQANRPGSGHAAFDGDLGARVGLGWGLVAGLQVQRSDAEEVSWRPGASLLWQFLGREGGDVALAVGGVFRAEGMTEPEGEAELVLAGSWTPGRAELHLNLVGGGEPDGNEGDAEAALAAGYRVLAPLLIGVEGRGRVGFGEKAGGFAHRHDEIGAGLAQFRFDRFLLTGLAGVQNLGDGDRNDTGLTALMRLGCAF